MNPLSALFARSASVHAAAKRHPLLARALGEHPRSPQWPALERRHLAAHPFCAACGSKAALQVHHIQSFREHPELELEPTNLITLCEGRMRDHLLFGHGGDFRFVNPNVVADAAEVFLNVRAWAAVVLRARKNRL